MKVGEIYRADLPTADGHEQSGRRPVMVIQHESISLSTVLVVPLTAAKAAGRFAGTVPIPITPENGLTADSVLLVFQIRAVDRKRFESKIGVVDPAVLAQVYASLDKLTARP